MKISTKLIAGFLIVAFVLVAVVGASIVLEQRAESAQKKADDEIREINEITELQKNMYEEHLLAVDYITTENPVDASAKKDKKEAKYYENEAALEELVNKLSEEAEFNQVIWEDVESYLVELEITFQKIITLKESGQLGAIVPISRLNELIDDIMVGNSLKDQEGLDNMIEKLDRELDLSYKRLDAYSRNRDFLYRLIAGIYRKHTLCITALTTDDLIVATNANEEIEWYSWVNEELYATLMVSFKKQSEENEVFANLILILDDTQKEFEVLDEMFEYNISQKLDGQLNNTTQEAVIVDLNDKIDDIMQYVDSSGHKGFHYISEMVNDEMDKYREYVRINIKRLEDLNQLSNMIYEEYTHYVKILTTDDLDEASVIFSDVEIDKDEDYLNKLINKLEKEGSEFETQAEIATLLRDSEKILEELDTTAISNISLKLTGQLDPTHWVMILQEQIEECMLGEGPHDEEGFDYIISNKEQQMEDAEGNAEDARTLASTITLVGVVIALVMAIGLGIVTSRAISKPVVGMTDAAKKVKEGNLNVSVDEKGSDEIAELGKAFNQMILSVRLLTGVESAKMKKRALKAV